jgi:hypothetical protein
LTLLLRASAMRSNSASIDMAAFYTHVRAFIRGLVLVLKKCGDVTAAEQSRGEQSRAGEERRPGRYVET